MGLQNASLAGTGDDLDYMHARHHSPLTGRFLSPDPALPLDRTMRSPQGWNRYAYTRGNPLSRVDRDGRLDFRFTVAGKAPADCDADLPPKLGPEIMRVPAGLWMSIRRASALSWAVCFALGWNCLSPALGQSLPSGRKATILARWQTKLRGAEADIRADRFARAKRSCTEVLNEMYDSIESGPSAGDLLALALTFRGLAAAGGDDLRNATWDWAAARSLAPAIGALDLTMYGAAGQKLAEAASVKRDGPPPRRPDDSEIQPPRAVVKPAPRYPAAVRAGKLQGVAIVETVIEPDGTLTDPKVLMSEGSAVLGFAVLETLRSWRFKPATLNGQPVPVSFVFTVNFKIDN